MDILVNVIIYSELNILARRKVTIPSTILKKQITMKQIHFNLLLIGILKICKDTKG